MQSQIKTLFLCITQERSYITEEWRLLAANHSFFQLLLKDTSTVSDTLIAVKMKCVISKSQDALSSYQITLLSQMETLVSFIVFISLH